MELIRGWQNLRPRHKGCVATIGNFDGVHLGHQAVLARLREAAGRLELPATLITFEPHPLEVLRPELAPPRLASLRDKLTALGGQGVERVLVLRFGRRFAQMEAEAFIQELLLDSLGVRFVMIGDDFRFGRGRAGDFRMLEEVGAREGFEVERMPTVEVDGERVSSSRIRAALGRNDLETAERLLGRPYSICGRVRHGQALGRTLGFATANLGFGRSRPPLQGIYVVNVRGLGPPRPGVASLGTRPTVNGSRILLEVHLLDFQGDLYGRQIQVDFLRWLRDEERFDSLEAMREQISRDVQAAHAYFDAPASSIKG